MWTQAKLNLAAGCSTPTSVLAVSAHLVPPSVLLHVECQVLINPSFLLTTLSCNHYLVRFHYHNCLPSDFKQVLPSVPPHAPAQVDGLQALSCSPLLSKSTHPHCSNYSRSSAFGCRDYKGIIMTQLPSTMRCWQNNHLSANELSVACMRLSGPHSAKSSCYLRAFKANTNNRALHYPEWEHSFLRLSCPHTEIQIEAAKVEGKYLKTKCLCPISLAKKSWTGFVESSWKPIIIFPAHLFTEECVPGAIWQVCVLESQHSITLSSQWIRAKFGLETHGTLRQGTKPQCTINADQIRKILHLVPLSPPTLYYEKFPTHRIVKRILQWTSPTLT